jgi:hypothetical protein
VPGGGIEPPQAFWALRILSPLRLPISPSRRSKHSSVGMRNGVLRSGRIARLSRIAVLGVSG